MKQSLHKKIRSAFGEDLDAVSILVPTSLSSPKGPCAESARAVTGRRCPHSGVGEDFLVHRPGPITKTGVTRERKVVD